MGFNGLFISGDDKTFFGLKKGASGIGFSSEKSTFFTLKKGANGVGFSSDISYGRILLSGLPYTQESFITVSDGATTYQTSTSDGTFPIYHLYNRSTPFNPTNFTVTVNSFTYQAVVNVTAGNFDIYDFNLVDNGADWALVRVQPQTPLSFVNPVITNAFLRDDKQGVQPLPAYPLTFASGSFVANETSFKYGYELATVSLECDITFDADLTAQGFGTRSITQHLIMPFK